MLISLFFARYKSRFWQASMMSATILFEPLCVLAQARVQREPISRG